METINSGNKKIKNFMCSSMETDIHFLLVLFPCLGAGRLLPGGGGVVILLGDHYKNLHWFWGVIFG